MRGRFPTFSGSGYIKKPYKVLLNDEAAFAKDMRVQLFQNQTNLYAGSNQILIGSFNVPIASMVGTLYKRPQYFNIVDSDGNIQGKILARFFLLKKNTNGSSEEAEKEIIFNYMQRVIQEVHTVDLKVSVLGIRDLVNPTKDCVMTVGLTNSQQDHGISTQAAYRLAQKKKKDKRGDDEDDEDDEEMGNRDLA